MAPKSYSLQELLALRGHSQVGIERRFIDVLNDRGECAEILRVRHLVAVVNGDAGHGSADQGITEIAEPVRQQLDGQETDMNVEESVVGDQGRPIHTAPPDLSPDITTGFGQFIKAVTSPTNVRVTAGGRIVANTRGTSPTGKIFREKGPGEGLALSRPGSQVGTLVGTVAGPYMQPHTVFPAYNTLQHIPGVVPSMPFFSPTMAFPMTAMSVGPGIFPQPPGSFYPAPSMNKHTGEDNLKATDQKSAGDSNMNQQVPNGPTSNYHAAFFQPASMMAMPMQMPMQMPMIHPQMPFQSNPGSSFGYPHGGPSAVYGHASGPMSMPGPQYGHYPAPSPMTMPPPAPTHLSDHHYPLYMSYAQSINVPISSIKLSDVIKKHLQGFRDHLKWLRDQLRYNTHQIDEKDMNARILYIRGEIASHERRLREQLEIDRNLAGEEKASKLASKSETDLGVPEKPSEPDESIFASDSLHLATHEAPKHQEFKSQQDDGGPYSTYKKDRSRSKAWNMKQKSIHLKGSTDNDEASVASSALMPLAPQSYNVVPEPIKKSSGLPRTAALAPPFEPRGYRELCSLDFSSDSAVKIQENNPDIGTRNDASLFETASGHPTGNKYAVKKSKETVSEAPAANDLGKPYLEGKLKYGIDPRTARDDDYSYPRKLTEEELQARRLYWGKAPRSVTQGLPKYDGKDFYHASPVKERYPTSPVKENLRHFETKLFGEESAISTSGYTDYAFKPARPIEKISDAAAKKAAADRHNDYKALLEQHYQKGEMADRKAREKRFTKSDNINGAAIISEKDLNRDRPATSLFNQEVCDSDQIKAPQVVSVSGPAEARSAISVESDSSHELLFKGRRNMQRSSNRNGLWKSLGKKNSAGSANALPGAMSSTTAHGVLPQYAGSAAASLNPAMGNLSVSTGSHTSPAKAQRQNEQNATGRQGENKPLLATKGADLRY